MYLQKIETCYNQCYMFYRTEISQKFHLLKDMKNISRRNYNRRSNLDKLCRKKNTKKFAENSKLIFRN